MPQNGIAAWIRDVEAADEEAVGPRAALTAVLRVSETIVVCNELREYPNLQGAVAKTILDHRQILVRHNDVAGPKIADLPARDADGVPPLWDQMQESIASRAGLRPSDGEAGPAAAKPSREGDDPCLHEEPIADRDEARPANEDSPS